MTDPLMTGASQQFPTDNLRLFSLRSRLLLGLCFALIAVAWIASIHFPQMWPRDAYFQGFRIHLWAGRVTFEYADVPSTTVARIDSYFEGWGRNPLLEDREIYNSLRKKMAESYGQYSTIQYAHTRRRASWRNCFGFEYLHAYGWDYVLVIPIWSFALLPVAWIGYQWLRHGWRVRRLNAGRCLACGYDLRATPERCPECGRAIGSSSTPLPSEATK